MLRKKQGFLNRNMLDVWLREMEVTITDAALAYFIPKWITEVSSIYWNWLGPTYYHKAG